MNLYAKGTRALFGYAAGFALIASLSAVNNTFDERRRLEELVVCTRAAQESPEYAVAACQEAVKTHSRNAARERHAAFMRSERDASIETLSAMASDATKFIMVYSMIIGYIRRTERFDRLEQLNKERMNS